MDFETELKQYILERYCYEYNSQIYIEKNDTSYVLTFALNRENKPLVIGGDFSDDESFLSYVKKEIDKRRFFLLQVFKISNLDNYPDTQLL